MEIDIVPNHKQLEEAKTLFYRGLAYSKQERYDLAIADYTEALKLNPQFVDGYNSRGLAYYKQGYYFSARRDYEKALELDPTGTAGQEAREYLQWLRDMGY